ncbi:hypothetical protein SAMN05216298_0044 [Glycomyces sambucus]|uniref:DUF4276 family protein n=1 Tax=Glycomyces sambucus TaxID=380244 RepID=A0A1G9MYG0_9ACTN|nr:hypothetical protein [Glycomyces sambucus]SDL79356.1 hypothetical protein SAMN05216298_0044 [Glycomyces sambucus]
MRDIVFLVADNAMVQLLRGFFDRDQFHRVLGCRSFDFDADQDIAHAPYKDSHVYGSARELLSPYEKSHQFAVVLVDAKWEGSRGADHMREHIGRSLRHEWKDRHKVIVFDPELEIWLWQDNPNVGKALGCKDFRKILAESGHWPVGMAKPAKPKAALEHLRRRHRADKGNAVFRRVAGAMSFKNCTDPSFAILRDTLRDWFEEDRK